MSTDHSDYQSKIFVRQKGLALIKPPYRVIELYAGAGVLTQNLWLKVADEVLSIEREPDKFKLSHPNLTTITENCTYHIDKIANYNVIDCDAYGLVLPVLLKCIDHANPGSIIFFTEFNPIRYKKDWEGETIKKLASNKKARGVWYIKSSSSQVIYGYVLV